MCDDVCQFPFSSPVVARGLCAYAFKQVYDSHRGLLAYVRVLSGSLKSHTSIYNLSTNSRWTARYLCMQSYGVVSSRERVTRVLMAQADQLQDVKEAGEGRIAVAVGLKNVRCSHYHPVLVQHLQTHVDLYWRHSSAVNSCGQILGGRGCGLPVNSSHCTSTSVPLHCGAIVVSQPEE